MEISDLEETRTPAFNSGCPSTRTFPINAHAYNLTHVILMWCPCFTIANKWNIEKCAKFVFKLHEIPENTHYCIRGIPVCLNSDFEVS